MQHLTSYISMIMPQMILPTVTLGCPKEKRGNDICGMCHEDAVRLHLFNRKPASQSMSLDASLPKSCITGTVGYSVFGA